MFWKVFKGHHETQHNGLNYNSQHNGLHCDTQNNDAQHKVMLRATCLMLCWVSFCSVSLCWLMFYYRPIWRMLLFWVSLCWVLFCWVSLFRMSLFWVSNECACWEFCLVTYSVIILNVLILGMLAGICHTTSVTMKYKKCHHADFFSFSVTMISIIILTIVECSYSGCFNAECH